ncbi:MAG: PIN domain-containing protein [Desulfobacteraceae bacterium]|nr:MAG: PIN domain-containing protein [Desulfobacteraceae bacterium]
MRISLDTNVLAYAEGVGDEARCRAARQIAAVLPVEDVLLPVQVLGELHRALTGKAGWPTTRAGEAVLAWADAFPVGDTTWQAMRSAFDLTADHKLQFWDALILAVSAEHMCRLVLTEDLQDGFTWRGVTVANPFLETRHPLLRALL